MNKTELIAAVAAKTGLTKKDAERVVNATIETITESMEIPCIDWSTGWPLTDPKWAGGPYTLVQNYVPPQEDTPESYEEIVVEPEQVEVEDAALFGPELKAYVLVGIHNVERRFAGTLALMAHVRKSVAGASRNAHSVGQMYARVEHIVEHAGCENATHASTFEHKSGVAQQFCWIWG